MFLVDTKKHFGSELKKIVLKARVRTGDLTEETTPIDENSFAGLLPKK
jgi:hypothetical protein